MKCSPKIAQPSGFTLLEVVVAMGIFIIISGMVLKTASTSLALGNTIVETQNEEMLHQAFFELINQRFSSLPGNTRFDLTMERSGGHYLSDLTLQNVPLSFSWGGETKVAKAVRLSTVKRRSGFLDVVLYYYENEVLEDAASSFGSTATSKEPFAEIVLLTDVQYFEWRALDGRSMEWQDEWDIQGRMPLQMELLVKFGAQGEEIRQIFWIPPKQNPEILMRQMAQSGGGDTGGGAGGGGNPNIPGGGGNPGGGGSGGGQPPPIQIPGNN